MGDLKDLSFVNVMLWIVPGALLTLFRSFAIRGSFPSLGSSDKPDLG